MRVECEACHELVAASFALDGGAVRASCPACRHAMAVPLAPAVAGDAPVCPKCGAPRRGDAACPSCGLAAANMAAYRDARDAAVPGPAREAWARALEAWGDPARHDEVLQQVAAHRCYAWAAACYRARGRDPIAERQLDRLRRAAEATLLASATARPDAAPRPYRATAGVLAILIVAVLVGLVYATVLHAPAARTAPAAPARALTPGPAVDPSTIR